MCRFFNILYIKNKGSTYILLTVIKWKIAQFHVKTCIFFCIFETASNKWLIVAKTGKNNIVFFVTFLTFKTCLLFLRCRTMSDRESLIDYTKQKGV